MAARLAKDQLIDLDFYGSDEAVLILASWDEDEENDHPVLEAEVLAKYFVLKRGGV
jgi:hypothetical protein